MESRYPEDSGPRGDQSIWLLGAGVRDAFLLLLFLALTQTTNKQIRRCPECQRIFRAVGKQRYCDRRCTNRASQRTWRKGQGKQAVN